MHRPLTHSRRAVLKRRVHGFTLTSVMLSLIVLAIVTGIGAQLAQNNLRRSFGHAEATVLQEIRNRVNAIVFSNQISMQAGSPLTVNGVTVTPAVESGVLTWRPTIAQLQAMNALPPGWSLSGNSINGAPYMVRLALMPAGCLGPTCDITGEVYPAAPFRSPQAPSSMDGLVVEAILNDIGSDAGVSLPQNATQITGFNEGWAAPNPLPGNPFGVVAVRVGTLSAALAPLVRIGDNRDPNLAGNLTVAGNSSVGGNLDVTGTGRVNGALTAAGPTTLQGPVTVANTTASVRDASGTVCVDIQPNGVVTIACTGQLNAVSGVFRDVAGNSSTITPTGVVATGSVQAQDGFFTPLISLFRTAEPDTIRVSAGDMFVRGASGTLMRVTADGDVVAGKNLAGQRLSLSSVVTPGTACTPISSAAATGQEFAATNDGGIALCLAGRWTSMARTGATGTACSTAGAIANDAATGAGLICRGSTWVSVNESMGRFALMDTVAAANGETVTKPACAGTSVPHIILVPANEGPLATDAPLTIYGANRLAVDNGAYWTVSLLKSDLTPYEGYMLAHTYCWTPSI